MNAFRGRLGSPLGLRRDEISMRSSFWESDGDSTFEAENWEWDKLLVSSSQCESQLRACSERLDEWQDKVKSKPRTNLLVPLSPRS